MHKFLHFDLQIRALARIPYSFNHVPQTWIPCIPSEKLRASFYNFLTLNAGYLTAQRLPLVFSFTSLRFLLKTTTTTKRVLVV